MKARTAGGQPATVRLQELIGRLVLDADGRRLGRVVECLAEPWGEELRVVALLIGPTSWWARFGPAPGDGGLRVRWEDIGALDPHIVLRLGAGDGQRGLSDDMG